MVGANESAMPTYKVSFLGRMRSGHEGLWRWVHGIGVYVAVVWRSGGGSHDARPGQRALSMVTVGYG
jgi:hypothetical protein